MTGEKLLEAAQKFYVIHKDCIINDVPIKEYLEIGLKALEQNLAKQPVNQQKSTEEATKEFKELLESGYYKS